MIFFAILVPTLPSSTVVSRVCTITQKGYRMNRIPHAPETSGSRVTVRRLLAATLLGSAAAAPVQAQVMTFDGPPYPLLHHGDSFEQNGMLLTALSNDNAAEPGDLVGALVDAGDTGTCAVLACPVGHGGTYYAALNDSVLYLNAARPGASFRIKSFDASFIGADSGATYPGVAGLLQVQGFDASGGTAYETYALGGPGNDGFAFAHYATSSVFGNQDFTTVAIFAYACEYGTGCVAFSNNRGQFALDNISAVPEPAAWLLMFTGLAGIGALLRRPVAPACCRA